MKHLSYLFVITALLWSNTVLAHDIAVENADGILIYYNYSSDGKELTVTYKGDNKYSNYEGNIVIPEEVTYMNRNRKVTAIGDYAFATCIGLTSVTIPNSVTTIGEYAFHYCLGLTSVTIPNSVTTIGEHAFEYCSGLTSVTIPNSVTNLGRGAFYNCTSVTSVNISNSITKIDGSTFGCCFSLTSVSIPNGVKIIEDAAFDDCINLTSVTIPNSVTSIGKYAFRYCESLTSIVIPDGVSSIGLATFYSCLNLTSVTIPNSVTSIGSSAFRDCPKLTALTIPNSVTRIENSAFQGCTSLTSLTIPSSVSFLGHSVFSDVDLTTVISLIENPFVINGKESYRYDYTGTFSQNTYNKANLYIPRGTIEKYKATNGWKDFTYITEGTEENDVPDGPLEVIVNNIKYHIKSTTKCEIISGGNYSGDIVIPEKVTINGKEYVVTSIGNQAFFENPVTSVSIPNSVTSIGDEAFRGCTKLTSVNIPNNVTQIGEWAFAGTAITSATIPNGVTTLSKSIFNGCDYLASVTIPNSVTSIGYKAFYRCLNLASIIIPNSVTSIGELAFWECRSLTSITIPNSVTSIGAQAFNGEDEDAPKITTVISLIENPYEIYGKSSYATNRREYLGVFTKDIFNNATLYVPKGTINNYKSTNGWKDFVFIEENPNDTGIQYVINDGDAINDIHSINGEKINTPTKGINIIKIKDGTTKKVLVR